MMSPMLSIEDQITEFFAARDVYGSARVLVAVSGGADSMALLHLLAASARAQGVAHFDHQTRAGASAEDATFVKHTADALHLPFYLGAADVASTAAEAGESFEQAARRLRHDFLLKTVKEHGFTHIATGHTRDDQVETILMRVLRGTSISGLGGIPDLRNVENCQILRPLLTVDRNALRAWLEEQKISWREDASNADPVHERNRVRHELLPHLRTYYNPSLDDALLRLAEHAREDNNYIARFVNPACFAVIRDKGLHREMFQELSVALQRRVVLQFGWNHGVNSTFEQVERVRQFVSEAATGASLEWAQDLRLQATREYIAVWAPPPPHAVKSVLLAVPGETHFADLRFSVEIQETLPAGDLRTFCTPHRQVFDAGRAGANLHLRFRKPGDRFAPLGLGGTKKLSDYFIDAGVPGPERDEIPLLVSEKGILWIVGHAISQAAAVDETTRSLLVVQVGAINRAS